MCSMGDFFSNVSIVHIGLKLVVFYGKLGEKHFSWAHFLDFGNMQINKCMGNFITCLNCILCPCSQLYKLHSAIHCRLICKYLSCCCSVVDKLLLASGKPYPKRQHRVGFGFLGRAFREVIVIGYSVETLAVIASTYMCPYVHTTMF
jgi:hypothetical protein